MSEIPIDKILCIDCKEGLKSLPSESVDCIITSPPYNISVKYGNVHKNGRVVKSKGIKYDDSLPEEKYRELLKETFKECQRVLKKNGSIWLNMKNRTIDSVVIPPFWIFEIFRDMFLKNIIIWNFDWGGSTDKRFSPRYEYVFWFTKNKDNYTFNLDEIKIPALNYRPDRFKSQWKNPSDVWYIQMVSGNYAERTTHPAQYPEELIERIVKVGTKPGDIVLDPFIGSGTTARVAKDLKRHFIGFDTNPEYVKIGEDRLKISSDRKKKESKDVRPLYFLMEDKQLSEFVKKNGRNKL